VIQYLLSDGQAIAVDLFMEESPGFV